MENIDFKPSLLGIAVDVSGSMQSSIQNDNAMDLSRLDGVEKGIESLLRDSQRIAHEHGDGAELPLRIFVYAFGLRTGDGYADTLSLLTILEEEQRQAEQQAVNAGNAIRAAVETQEFKRMVEKAVDRAEHQARQRGEDIAAVASSPELADVIEKATRRAEADAKLKGERMRRSASSEYGGIAAAARAFGLGAVVDSVASSAAANAERQLRAEAEGRVLEAVAEFFADRMTDPLPKAALKEIARVQHREGTAAAEKVAENKLKAAAEKDALKEIADFLYDRLDGSVARGDLLSIAQAHNREGIEAANATAEEVLRRSAENDVRAAITRRLRENPDTTMTTRQLAEMWSRYSFSSTESRRVIFGSTPMRACLAEVSDRFERERGANGFIPDDIAITEESLLLVISDGEPTDGRGNQVAAIAAAMRDKGVHVACAYITDRDVQTPRSLVSTEQPGWPSGARLLFEMASPIEALDAMDPNEKPAGAALRQALEQAGWTVPVGARLFLQVNHSEVLADFMRVAATAMPARNLLSQGINVMGEEK